jgi:hypothetical protein
LFECVSLTHYTFNWDDVAFITLYEKDDEKKKDILERRYSGLKKLRSWD